MACSYILWKAVAKHLPSPEQRTAFCTGVGQQLLQQLLPEAQQQLQAAAQRGERSVNRTDSGFSDLVVRLSGSAHPCAWVRYATAR